MLIGRKKMIREFKMEDLDRIMEIWLNSNIDAHPFINKNIGKIITLW